MEDHPKPQGQEPQGQEPEEPLTVGRIIELAGPTSKQPQLGLRERLEDMRVCWQLMDEMQKQAVILSGVYAAYTILDVLGAVVKTRFGVKEGQ